MLQLQFETLAEVFRLIQVSECGLRMLQRKTSTIGDDVAYSTAVKQGNGATKSCSDSD